jgi:hypothetical protein
MKKTLVSALTTAIVVGAASTTFAAANPFEDVPADHWAYDAIAQLAADGVIEGYGDGTYRGDQEITRYEMAQMIARAMAKGGGDKALIDKLAAEFADELNNLGVRVAALEKKVDNVKWKGEIRYQFSKVVREHGYNAATGRDENRNYVQLRLKPSMQINKNWTGYAGLYYGAIGGTAANPNNKQNLNNAANIDGNNFLLKYAYVEGVYGNTVIDLGRTVFYTVVDEGMIMDQHLAGGRVTFGKDLKFSIGAGRHNTEDWLGNGTSTYVGGELTYNKNNFFAGAGYHYFGNKAGWSATYGDDSANIWVVGLGYKFGDFRLFGAYAQNTQGGSQTAAGRPVANSSAQRKAYNIQLDYKGAKPNKPGSFGLSAGYRHLGQFASLTPTYDYFWNNMKGWFVGGKVTLMPNVTLELGYSNGKTINTELKQNVVYSRACFYF